MLLRSSIISWLSGFEDCFYSVAALIAVQSVVLAIADLSVCLSFTCWCFVQRNEDMIKRSSVSGSTMTLVSINSLLRNFIK